MAAIYSYSKTKGLFAGVSIEGSVIVERKDTNEAFYRQHVTAAQLLSGVIPPPPEADILYRALDLKASRGPVDYRGSPNGSSHGDTDFYHQSSNSASSSSPQLNRSASTASPGRFGNPQQYQHQAYESNGYNSNNNNSSNIGAAAAAGGRSRASTNAGTYGGNYNNNNDYHGSESKAREAGATASHDDPVPRYTPMATSNPFQDNNSPVGSRPPPAPPRMAAKPELLTALYDFVGEQATDLSFKKGDRITVVKKTDSTNDWWTGRIGTREGSFPRNYCQ